MTTKRSPADFLKQVLGRVVHVKLNSGIEYQGSNFIWSFCLHLKVFLLVWMDF